jgi:hypothetical protein
MRRLLENGMRLYPDIPARRARTMLRDALVLVLLALFAWLGLRVHGAVDRLAVLGEGVRRAGAAVPLVGDPVEDLGRRGEEGVHDLARLLGLVMFGLPAALLLVRYVPRRVDQVRRLTAADRVLRGGDARLVAMRAAFSLPYGRLLAYTQDPLGDLAHERYEALVTAAFDEVGLRPR